MEMKECSIIKRNVKDSLFLSFFSEKNNVLDLYREMHPEDTVSTIDDLSIRTIKRVLVKGYTNDLGFSVGNRFICLVEAQSYYLKSMQIRTFFYLANSYQNYLEDNGLSLYNIKEEDVPEWEAYVVSTGRKGGVFKLSGFKNNLFDDSSMEAVPEKGGNLLREYI